MRALGGFSIGRLRLWLIGFFVLLAAPSLVLVNQAFTQLRWESFHQQQTLAEELAARIDAALIAWVNAEQARPAADYEFLALRGADSVNYLQRSPLAEYPVAAAIPGLIGHFQIDATGRFSTPLLPDSASAFGSTLDDLAARQAHSDQLVAILSQNALVDRVARPARGSTSAGASYESAPAPTVAEADVGVLQEERVGELSDADLAGQLHAESSFDKLSRADSLREKKTTELGSVQDLPLESNYLAEAPAQVRQQNVQNAQLLEQRVGPRKERTFVTDTVEESLAGAAARSGRISVFESAVGAFEFGRLASGHFVLYRTVWTGDGRTIQGALVDAPAFVSGVFVDAFQQTALSQRSDLSIAYDDEVMVALRGGANRGYLASSGELAGELLYQTALSAPLDRLQLIFSVSQLPVGPGGRVIAWSAAAAALVLVGGLFALYGLGKRQLALVQQQQDFVSSVSHELKTPLTSIRMYGEMLREGWTPEDRRQQYYDYIYAESERLSRLIANVLQLARMTRNELHLTLTPQRASELLDLVRSKVGTAIDQAGFGATFSLNGEDVVCAVDADAIVQIVINLVDNALKFAANSEQKRLLITFSGRADELCIGVRDHGPGIPREHLRRIFDMFYRVENELTRETMGTGIGLALVHQLTRAMGGKVEAVNRDPGAEFRIVLPVVAGR